MHLNTYIVKSFSHIYSDNTPWQLTKLSPCYHCYFSNIVKYIHASQLPNQPKAGLSHTPEYGYGIRTRPVPVPMYGNGSIT